LLRPFVACQSKTRAFKEDQIMQAAASLDRAVSAAATADPTVTYDVANKKIQATVIATLLQPNEYDVVAPPLSVPKATWTVFWNLQSDDPSAEISVDLPSNPLPSGNVTVSNSGRVSPTQWTAIIANNTLSFNGFSYGIHVGQSSLQYPTVAVTPDPPPGG
jgi:hypothetical protein